MAVLRVEIAYLTKNDEDAMDFAIIDKRDQILPIAADRVSVDFCRQDTTANAERILDGYFVTRRSVAI